ncbi:hypothetical protein F5884DRAFT_751797 [Xylogone sp. PMI_703]|nr:hypothetical protein F5884DRAFT_751797 [Xylogone sp. PMI_703]
MLAAYATKGDLDDPLSAIKIGQQPIPKVRDGWLKVKITTAGLNYHDNFTLRGVGPHPLTFPGVLGCEACGTLEDGTEVILYPVMGDPNYRGDETLDPKRHVFHEITDGTLAEYTIAPIQNILPRPKELPATSGAVLGVSWLTAYRMLFTKASLRPGQSMLVQGCSGGVATALIQLGAAAGMRVWCTGRTEEKRNLAMSLGAEQTFPPGHKLTELADVVFDISGTATWEHSIASAKTGGKVVTCGAHGGIVAPTDLMRIFVD